jgi:hypothetical protein
MINDHEIHRFEDDGGPPVAPKIRIGIAPKASAHSNLQSQAADYSNAARLILPLSVQDGRPVQLILPIIPEEPTVLTWPEYVAWRKTKCPPVDDLARATLELVGEVAELAELCLQHGPATFYGELRDKLIDECGDIFFCAIWALDSWGKNPFAEADDLEMVRVDEDDPILLLTGVLATNSLEAVQHSPSFVAQLGRMIYSSLASMQMHAGITANATKKHVYQGRPQDIDAQVGRIVSVLLGVNQLLIVANSNVEEALTVNRTKLDARYPDGWHSSVGGGIREGAGK